MTSDFTGQAPRKKTSVEETRKFETPWPIPWPRLKGVRMLDEFVTPSLIICNLDTNDTLKSPRPGSFQIGERRDEQNYTAVT